MYKFEEVDFLVGISVDTEEVPEDIVEFSFGGFLQNLDDEASEFALLEVSLLASVVAIEVGLELIPNGLHEGQFLFGDTGEV